MKILHYREVFSELSETFIYDYVKELERQGTKNFVLTRERKNIADRPFKKIIEIKIPGQWNVERNVRGFFGKLRGQETGIHIWPQMRKNIKRKILEIEPDIIHAHFGPEGVVVGKVAHELNIPLVVSFYGHDISRSVLSSFWRSRYRKLLRHQNCIVIVLSEQMKAKVKEIGFPQNRIEIVHLSRDLTQFNLKHIPSNVQKFVSVGRLTPKKGHFDTINAFEKLLEAGYNIKLEIIGDGELRNNLQEYIQEKEVQAAVKLLGPLPNKEVITKLKEADAFILCSKTAPDGDKEGTPTVLVEAQAVGLPCISTFHAGIPEMIPEDNHFFLAQEGNVQQIAERVERLIHCDKNKIEEISKAGRKKIDEDYKLSREVEKLRKLYNNLSLN
jgi:glycosyltransferase involved in cell wall biosynthesis